MSTDEHHRFSPDIIFYFVCLYYRFNLSDRDIENLLAERGITISLFLGALQQLVNVRSSVHVTN